MTTFESRRWRSRPGLGALVAGAGLTLAACGGGGDGASDARSQPQAKSTASSCASRSNDTFDKLLECVTLAGVREHQAAFQAIADANGGTRSANTPGYEESVDYVADKMTAAGYAVTLDPFDFTFRPASTLQQLTPVSATYATGAFTNSGSGTVTGNVIPVDINLTPPRASTSGCEAADFAGLDFSGPNDIALIQRGTCFFADKALNAQAAGAEAVIIFNQGNDPTREALFIGTLAPATPTIPVVGASFADAVALAQPGSTATIIVPPPQTVTQYNVIAESRSGDPNNVVMVGAHLDSVPAGPGINDNGSGSAAILEVAEQMAKVKPRNRLRFAWWGAEESGLIGSTAYVNDLSQAERDRIALYLNFDMVGSPNYMFGIYDGDGSDNFPFPPSPAGSGAIEKVFQDFYLQSGLEFQGTAFSGRSDYGPFIAIGIPAGGLFTGAEGLKTPEEVAKYGGVAGQQYDPCYHLACDTINNVNTFALGHNADAVAYATLLFAMNTSSVNGVRGKGSFKVKPMPGHNDPPPAQ